MYGEKTSGPTDFTSMNDLEHSTTVAKNGGVSNADGSVPPSPYSRREILRNLVTLSLSFMFLFTAFQSLQNLQSSLNKEQGLGTVTLAVLYACGVVAGIFLPPLVIKKLGCKWTLVASMACYIVFMGANLYAIWGTMIPASVIVGLGAATLWAAKCTYLTQIGAWYAGLTHTSKDGVISVFFGVFFACFQTSQIWGNLISSTIFSQNIPDNQTISEDVLATCGVNYCPSDFKNNSNLDRPSLTKVYTVCGIYLGCACLAALIVAVCLDNIRLDTDSQEQTTRELLTSIARHFRHSRYQQLLIPLTIYSGVEQAFMAGDYTRSFVSCSLGLWNVGYVMIAYGVADATFSLIIGRLVKYTGFIPWFCLVFVLHGGCQIALLVWSPSPDYLAVFYVIAVLWGIGDAIIQTLVNALYGVLFTKKPETAFASYRLCESAGFILTFGYSGFICTNIKIVVCLVLVTLGVALYGVVETLHRREVKADEHRNN